MSIHTGTSTVLLLLCGFLAVQSHAVQETAVPGEGPPDINPDMVPVAGGRYEVGSLLLNIRDNPVREICLSPFHIGRFEVTFREYDRFARATSRVLPHDLGWGRDDRPVVDVTREDAEAYAAWLSGITGETYRLPTEEEWEVAARGIDSPVSQYSGDEVDSVDANCAECDTRWSGETAPVGQFAPTAAGLYDVHGNVWEWTATCYRDVTGDCTVGVVKGGSWDTALPSLRFSHRAAHRLDRRSSDVGFRLVREAGQAEAPCSG